MRKMNLLHGALILGLAFFGVDYNARHVGYNLGLKDTESRYESKIEQMQDNYEQETKISSDRSYDDGFKAARFFDKIDMADMKAGYENLIETLDSLNEIELENTREAAFKRGWETGYSRAEDKYAPEPEIYIDEEPMKSSPGGSPDSMDSRTGNEKLLKALQGIRESTNELNPCAIPDFAP